MSKGSKQRPTDHSKFSGGWEAAFGARPDPKVVNLEVIRQTPNQALITILENMLEDARAGELQGIAVAKVWSDQLANTSWALAHDWQSPTVIGQLHMLITQLSNNNDGLYSEEDFK